MKNSRALLGSSLAKIGEQSKKTSQEQILELALTDIRCEDQVRKQFDPDALQELANSILEEGLIQPVVVTNDPKKIGGYVIYAGERRFRASQLAGVPTIRAILRQSQDSKATVIGQLTENLQRENLSPLEISEALKELSAQGLSYADIAKKLGKSKSWVGLHASLSNMDSELIAKVQSTIKDPQTLSTLHKIWVEDPEVALSIADEAATNGGYKRKDMLAQYDSLKKQPESQEQLDPPTHRPTDLPTKTPITADRTSQHETKAKDIPADDDGDDDHNQVLPSVGTGSQDTLTVPLDEAVDVPSLEPNSSDDSWMPAKDGRVRYRFQDANGNDCFLVTGRISKQPGWCYIQYSGLDGSQENQIVRYRCSDLIFMSTEHG